MTNKSSVQITHEHILFEKIHKNLKCSFEDVTKHQKYSIQKKANNSVLINDVLYYRKAGKDHF